MVRGSKELIENSFFILFLPDFLDPFSHFSFL
jgi:hypothetical protein